MFGRFAIFVVACSCANTLFADYVANRKEATALVKAARHEDALAAFLKMADDGASPAQKSDALEQAALCAITLQQYARAWELAQGIPSSSRSQSCQMLILESQRKWSETIERFGAADFDQWPESVRGEAYFRRGYAHFAMKNGAAAAADLGQAVQYLTDHNSKGLCLNYLGDSYSLLLKDDERAIETYRQTYRTGNVYKQCQAAISVAEILRRQRKLDHAIHELNRIEMEQITAPYWRGAMLQEFGRVLTEAGKKAEAIASYEQALNLPGLPDDLRKNCEELLKQLRGEP